MRPRAWVTTPHGEMIELGAGDLIGRMPGCRLNLNDPRVSEAHALVSLRGDSLKLLALRGRLEVRARATTEVTLRPGLVVSLAPNLSITVEEVDLPDEIPALRHGDGPAHTLLATTSLRLGDEPELVAGWVADAHAWLWSTGDGWFVQVGGQPAEPLQIGTSLHLEGHRFEVVGVPLHHAGHAATVLDGGREALRITLRFHNALIQAGDRSLVLDGMPGRLVCECAAMGGPTSWEVVAREVWKDEAAAESLRHRWDVNLARVRSRLREAGFRADLLRADRSGNIELNLAPGDTLIDEM